jgi:hypothetical protein
MLRQLNLLRKGYEWMLKTERKHAKCSPGSRHDCFSLAGRQFSESFPDERCELSVIQKRDETLFVLRTEIGERALQCGGPTHHFLLFKRLLTRIVCAPPLHGTTAKKRKIANTRKRTMRVRTPNAKGDRGRCKVRRNSTVAAENAYITARESEIA